jgi:chromosomal replication initiation ATPase DnaA
MANTAINTNGIAKPVQPAFTFGANPKVNSNFIQTSIQNQFKPGINAPVQDTFVQQKAAQVAEAPKAAAKADTSAQTASRVSASSVLFGSKNTGDTPKFTFPTFNPNSAVKGLATQNAVEHTGHSDSHSDHDGQKKR